MNPFDQLIFASAVAVAFLVGSIFGIVVSLVSFRRSARRYDPSEEAARLQRWYEQEG